MEKEKDGFPVFIPKDQADWRNWLLKNHALEKAVWLVLYRKGNKNYNLSVDEVIDQALCFGWIDSKPNKRDEESYYLFLSQRKAKSNWSKVNKVKIERLLHENLVHESGLKMVELARISGTWDALNEVELLTIPEDLKKKLLDFPPALDNFEAFPKSVKRGILEWILNAKRPETREKRIEETASLAAQNKRANQFPRN